MAFDKAAPLFATYERGLKAMDTLTGERRSAQMARIRSKDTQPEWVVRRLLHGLGYRYVLHDARLPGCPDLVFPARMKAAFIHGCFWHCHTCQLASKPKSHSKYWKAKLAGNKARGRRHRSNLKRQGWSTKVVWECETRRTDLSKLARMLEQFLTH